MVCLARRALLATMLVLFAALPALLEAADPSAEGLDLFEKKIRPVLVAHCYECHSQEAKILRAGLYVDSREGLARGGDSGPALTPGKPDGSLLLESLRYESYEMPPSGKLPDEVIADFARWIALGAPDPRDEKPLVAEKGYADLETGSRFWSFQPVADPPVPTVADASWPKSEIDRFLRSRQEAAGIAPVADADRGTLVRRLYYDLTGLPPTPEEVARFVNDSAGDALETLVDRLLASPEFGQRFGRHWLDVARYADSSGGGRELMHHNAWRYRDWVIDAFQQDKPIDTFIAEQVAGDLLPYDTPEQATEQLLGTGFLMLGPHNYEMQDKDLLRMEVVDEQLDTVGRALLGMTIGCARCHDHKFDPIPTSDYYALAGIFRSTHSLITANVSQFIERPLPGYEEQARVFTEHRDKLRSAEARLRKLRTDLANGPMAMAMAMQMRLDGIVVDNPQAELTGAWVESSHTPQFVGENYLHDNNQDKGRMSVTFRPNLPRAGRYEVRFSYTAASGRSDATPITIHHADGDATVVIDQRRRPPIDRLFVSLGEYQFKAGTAGRVVVSNRDTRGHVTVDAVQFVPLDGMLARAEDETPHDKQAREAEISRLRELLEAKIEVAAAEVIELRKLNPPEPPMCMSVREYPADESGDCAVHIRGNVRNLGYVVPRGFLSVTAVAAGKSIEPPQIVEGESGRRQLAEWLTDPANPLTARVYVNRVWYWVMGQGLVRTPDNFGSTGALPDQPELLDWLTRRFVDEGWSTKQLVRRIVLSRVYRLGSGYSESAARVDPENRLWWQRPRRRLDAESLRDTLLLVSGQLDPTAGGPTVRPGTTSELGYEYDGTRRSVYLPVFRNALYDFFDVFDFASPSSSIGARNTSVLPTQALFMMNSPLVMDAARATAERLLVEPHADDAARLERAFWLVLGRAPNAAERQHSLAYLRTVAPPAEGESAGQQSDAWTGLIHALFGTIDFRYVH